MKKLVLINLIFLCIRQLLAQTAFPCYNIINNPAISFSQNTGLKEYNGNCFEVSNSPIPAYGPIILENDAQTTFRANKSIHLKEGFQAKNYSASGFAHFTLGTVVIEPFIMNLGSNVVGKHKKIEIGFRMPEEIENQVNDYLSDPNNYFGMNPYDPSKINIVAEFKNSVNSDIITRHGFYYEYFEKEQTPTVTGVDNNNIPCTQSGIIKKVENNATMLKWRVRFAPDEVGSWYGKIKIFIDGIFFTDIVGINFECVPSNEHGYLEIGVHKRQFRFNDDNKSFYAIGQNLTWPSTLKYVNYSAVITNSNNQSYQIANGTEEWLHTFRNLGDNGGNFARTVFYQGDNMNSADGYDGGQEIEWEKLGDYQSRQHCMFVLDEVFDIAEQKGIFIILTPNVQNEFKSGTELGDKWSWNPYNSSSSKNANNPIKPIGVSSPYNFLTNTLAKTYYQRKLRYIHARWGYGPHLAAYELISEMNGWTGYSDEYFRNSLYDWQYDMFIYQKGILGVRQLISTSYNDSDPYDGASDHSAFSFVDFTSMHSYASKKHQSIRRQQAVNKILDDGLSDLSGWNKPTNFGEMGMGSNGADVNDWEKCDDTEWHNSLWATAFMECYGAGINWWANDQDDRRAKNFPAMKQFFSNVEFELDEWTKNQHWSNDPNETLLNYGYQANLEVFAMTTNSSHKAMGWIHQATNWWGNKINLLGCQDRNNNVMQITYGAQGDGDDLFDSPNLYPSTFQISGLIPFTQYQFDFFRTDDGAGAWYSSQFETTNILGVASPGIPDTYYDFAFKASKSGITFKDDNSSNTSSSAPKFDTVTCDTKSIKVNYIWFNDSLGLNKYEWTWVNRKSTEQFPEITFDKSGIYLVNLKIKFPNDSSVQYQQNIVVPNCKVDTILIDKYKNFYTSNECNLFPNPTSGLLTINLQTSDKYFFSIFDGLGNVLKSIEFNGWTTNIDCTDLPPGVYFIKVNNQEDVFNIKFVKQ